MKKIVSLTILIIIVLSITICYAYAPLKNKLAQIFVASPIYTMLNKDEIINIHQVITADSTNSRTIMWQTLDNKDDFIVEYANTNMPDKIEQITPTKTSLDIEGKTIYTYSATLTNLEAGQTYNYRIGYAKKRTNWYSLTTEANDTHKFKALIFADSQSNDYTDWHNLATTAYQHNSDANFFINMGDLVDNGYDLNQWNDWFASTETFITKIPVAPIQGNHETYTTDWQVAMPVPYLNFFNLPANGSEQYKNQYYSYDYGDVHFTVINTQDNEMYKFQPDMMQAQLAWLENDLASTAKKWKVVLMHRDILEYSRDKKPLGDQIIFTKEGKEFMPIFDKYHVDAVISAHLHTYRRRAQLTDFKPNDHGTLYILSGVSGNVRYPNLWHANPLDKFIAPQPETDNFMVLDASENKLTFSAHFPDNTLMDTITLTK